MKKAKRSRGRPKGDTPAMAHVNLRLPVEVFDFYKKGYSVYTEQMRQVLIEFAAKQAQSK